MLHCDCNSILDKFHYLFQCNLSKKERNMLPRKHVYYINPNVRDFHVLFNSDDTYVIFKDAKFSKIIRSILKWLSYHSFTYVITHNILIYRSYIYLKIIATHLFICACVIFCHNIFTYPD